MTLDLTLGSLITLAWVLTTVACVVMGVLVVATVRLTVPAAGAGEP